MADTDHTNGDDDPVLEAEARQFAEQVRAARRSRSLELARLSRTLGWAGLAVAAIFVAAWVFGALTSDTVAFRLTGLLAATLLALAFLIGALSAATARRTTGDPAASAPETQ